MSVEFGCSPTTWGVDFAHNPANPPWESVLDDIAAAGCRWLELGPVGYLPTDRDTLSAALSARDLRAIGSWAFQPIWDEASSGPVMANVRDTCRAIAQQDGDILVIVDRVNPVRDRTAGRSNAAERLRGRAWQAHMDRVRAIGEEAAKWGIRPVLHPHAGTYIEFGDEIEAALNSLGPETMGLCLDTGHFAFAGVDPADALIKYADRLEHVHLKDVDFATHQKVVKERLSFWQAIDLNVFCPIGDGIVDFGAVLRTLDQIGFDGVAILEQDRNPRSMTTPRDDLARSLAHLRSVR